MESDSDDDFERFLQEDDSASLSSASPVKRRSSKPTTGKAKAKSDKRGGGGTSSSRSYGASSQSVVAAAEKLLAGSARAKAAKQKVVEEDDDEEEPPPSYSDDPYAFDLGDAAYTRKSEDVDDESDRHRVSYRRDNKSDKRKSRKEESDKSKKLKSKSSNKDPPPPKVEVKAATTLEDRIAAILKRTGSTAYPSGVIASGSKVNDEEGGEEEDGDRDEAEAKAESIRQKTATTDDAKTTSGSKTVNVSETTADKSDSSGDLHRLSFSDSLGMESADFEVGTLAKRKLDRSRLSLSSLNSEKFAVNLDALEDSEHVSQNRYDQLSEGFSHTNDASEPADSDYGEDAFELDQTTEGMPANHDNASASSFVSQFESMKSVFSLESPIKPADSSPEIPNSSAAQSEPPQSENFGYDDEDFETDEVVPDTVKIEKIPDTLALPVDNDDYADEDFDDGGESRRHVETKFTDSIPQATDTTESLPRDSVQVTSPSQFKFEVVSTVVSVTETTTAPFNPANERTHSSSQPSPPQSPPPPPPPDNEDDVTSGPLSGIGIPFSTPTSLASQPSNVANAQHHRSAERMREIENQVASLRFMQDPADTGRIAHAVAEPSCEVDNHTIDEEEPNTQAEIKEIEDLMELAKRARRERRTTITTRSSVKESELALRLQQARRQLLQFKEDVRELARQDDEKAYLVPEEEHARTSKTTETSENDEDKSAAPTTETIKALLKERDELKKEMQSQEHLIQGFQRENEILMKQLKQLQRDVHYDVHKENESLRVQVKDLRTRLDGSPQHDAALEGTDSKIQYRAAFEARLQAEALAGSLQEELRVQARRHQDRVNEMKIELEKAKKAKIDLECKYEGINLEKMEAENQHIKTLREQLQSQKLEHEHALSALQKKIDWYVKNQRMLDEQDDKMNELKDENKQLKTELATAIASKMGGSASARSPRTPGKPSRLLSDIRRIQELESRLSDMEEAMRKRHPDSLVSLIVASRKADEESKLKEQAEEHQRQVANMMEEMETIQANNEKKLNAFRQQQEKLVLQYQKQIGELERQLAKRESDRGGIAAPVKTPKKQASAGEEELYRVRRFYAEKIKEVERKWEAKYRAVKKQHYAASGLANDNADAASEDAAELIRSLQRKIGSLESEIQRFRAGSISTGSWESADLRRRVTSLETQLKTSEDARRHLIETISSLNAIPHPTISHPVKDSRRECDFEARLAIAQKNHEQSLKEHREQIKTLENQLQHEVDAREQLVNQINGHVKEIERLQRVLIEAEKEKRFFQQAAEKTTALESELALLREQTSVPQTPSMLQFRSLELRIETLTQKHQLREAELKMLLAQANQSSQLEKLNYERMHRNAIALKNAEINKFKKQLGEILDELEAMRRTAPLPA